MASGWKHLTKVALKKQNILSLSIPLMIIPQGELKKIQFIKRQGKVQSMVKMK